MCASCVEERCKEFKRWDASWLASVTRGLLNITERNFLTVSTTQEPGRSLPLRRLRKSSTEPQSAPSTFKISSPLCSLPLTKAGPPITCRNRVKPGWGRYREPTTGNTRFRSAIILYSTLSPREGKGTMLSILLAASITPTVDRDANPVENDSSPTRHSQRVRTQNAANEKVPALGVSQAAALCRPVSTLKMSLCNSSRAPRVSFTQLPSTWLCLSAA